MGLVIQDSFSNRLAERPTSCELFHKHLQLPSALKCLTLKSFVFSGSQYLPCLPIKPSQGKIKKFIFG